MHRFSKSSCRTGNPLLYGYCTIRRINANVIQMPTMVLNCKSCGDRCSTITIVEYFFCKVETFSFALGLSFVAFPFGWTGFVRLSIVFGWAFMSSVAGFSALVAYAGEQGPVSIGALCAAFTATFTFSLAFEVVQE